MPRKIRHAQTDLRKAGFVEDRARGKGDHSRWSHPDHPDLSIVLDGQRNDDLKPYQEQRIQVLLREVREREYQRDLGESGR